MFSCDEVTDKELGFAVYELPRMRLRALFPADIILATS